MSGSDDYGFDFGSSSAQDDHQQQQGEGQSGAKDAFAAKKMSAKGGWQLLGYLFAWVLIFYFGRRLYCHYRNKRKIAAQDSWFGGHPERDAYEAAVGARASGDQSVDEEKLRKLLLRRAMTDMRRLLQITQEKEPLYNLMRSGAVSEEMWADFLEAERTMQVELHDLHAESETFKEKWSETIIKEAAELVKKEDQLLHMKREREREEKQRISEEKKAQRAKEQEERAMKEQEEQAAKLRERFLSSDAAELDWAQPQSVKVQKIAAGGKKTKNK